MLRFLLILVFAMISAPMMAQEVEIINDTLKKPADTVIMKNGRVITPEYYAKRYQPRKALLFSAVLPGMGQIYNKKYWKLPFVYGGFIAITWVVIKYNDYYIKYKDELFQSLGDPAYASPEGYSQEQLRSIVEQARRQRDYFLVIDAIWYVLQLVDAHVDAHLREFDLNPNLKVSWQPHMQRNQMIGQVQGFSITLKF